MLKESILYKKLPNKKVQCLTCNHKCIISNLKNGFCQVRKNKNGKLYFIKYLLSVAENIDPIEKKPLFDYMPKTKTLTIATQGCNFYCKWCQNWDISQYNKSKKIKNKKNEFLLTPERIIKDAFLNKCLSISYSYTEPTIFLEYALDIMKIANNKGLKNIWITNGYMTDQALNLIIPYLDAANIDLKTFDAKKYKLFTGGNLKYVLKNIKTMYKKNIHIELTTLIVPGFNDNKKTLTDIAKYIKEKISPQTPWHITRYFPSYKTNYPPTSITFIEDIALIAKKIGLKKVYTGNI